MKKMKARWYVLFLVITCVAKTATAHGPIHEKIGAVNKKLEKDPNNAELYIERAAYYKLDSDFDHAHADLIQAKSLDPSIYTIEFLAAELCYEYEHFNSALTYINIFEKNAQSLGETYLLKAKILDKLMIADSALIYITKAYPLQEKYNTSFFTLASEFSLYANKDDYETAMKWLELGKIYLPYDLVIQQEMVRLAIKFSKLGIAEKLCLEQLPKLKRKENWYYQLAVIYQLQSNNDRALEACAKAEDAINDLPRHHKNTDFIKGLSQKIQSLKLELKQT